MNAIYHAVFCDAEDKYAPPALPVLRVSVIGDTVFLDVCTHEEDNKTETLTKVAGVQVKAAPFANFLITAMLDDRSAKKVEP